MECIGTKTFKEANRFSFILVSIFILFSSSLIYAQSIEDAIARLNDTIPESRLYAIRVLEIIEDPKAVELLITALRDSDEVVREYAADGLGKKRDRRAIEPLVITLKDKNSDVRLAAVYSLDELNWIPQTEEQKALYHFSKQQWEKCIEIGDAAIEPLLIAIYDKRNDVSKQALLALGEINSKQVVELLIQYLMDNQSPQPCLAAKVLGRIGDLQAFEPLIFELKFGNSSSCAAEALGELGDSKAVVHLIFVLSGNSLISENYPIRRQYAARALGKLGDTLAVKPLIAALQDNSIEVRVGAAEALGMIEDKRAIAPLTSFLDDDSDELRYTVVVALIRLGDSQAMLQLVNMLSNWNISEKVAHTLDTLGWRPESAEDSVHLFVAERNGYQLINKWENTKSVLLNDVISGNYDEIQSALFAFISLGINEINSQLIEILNLKGNKTIAEAYLNCGNIELTEAAKFWARRHGYLIIQSGGSIPVSWGSWK